MAGLKNIFTVCFLLSPLFCFCLILNVKDYGAKGNGRTDDTYAFQNAVDFLKNKGGGILEIPPGNYPITFLKFFGKEYSNISLLGNNANILQSISGHRKSVLGNKFQTFAQRFAADGCFVFDAQVANQKDDRNSIKNIKISGLNFISDVKKHGFDELLHHISAHGVSNFTVENCSFTGFLGDGIAVNGATDFSKYRNAYNKDVYIRNCTFDGINKNNRQGISIYYSDGFTIEHCIFKNSTRNDMPGAIDIEPDSPANVSRNGTIRNCKFFNIGGLGAIAISLRKSTAENHFSNNGYYIYDCTFDDVNSPLTITGSNTVPLKPGKNYTVTFKNASVFKSKTAFRVINASGIMFENVDFKSVNFPMHMPVTGKLSSNILLKACQFRNLSSSREFIFYGSVKNLLFLECIFKGEEIKRIEYKSIKSTDKWSNIYFYLFLLVHYSLYLSILLGVGLLVALSRKIYINAINKRNK